MQNFLAHIVKILNGGIITVFLTGSFSLETKAGWVGHDLQNTSPNSPVFLPLIINQPTPPQPTKKIAFLSSRNGVDGIFLMDENGANVNPVITGSLPVHYLVWSPDGTKIAYEVVTGTGPYTSDIYIMNSDGSGQRNVTNHPSVDGSPAWSPDGQKIAFTSKRSGNNDLYAMNVDGSRLVNLTKSIGNEFDPAWSPEGTQIAFTVESEPMRADVMNTDGSGRFVLASIPNYNCFTPVWSPTGNTIAVTCQNLVPLEDPVIYFVDPDTKVMTFFTVGYFERWSPDGSKLTFLRRAVSGNLYYETLYVINSDGTGEALNLVPLSISWRSTWSPDSSKIAFQFSLSSHDEPDIYLIHAYGTGLTNLTGNPSKDSRPAWQP